MLARWVNGGVEIEILLPAFGSHKGPTKSHLNLRRTFKKYSIGIPTPLPTPQTKVDSISEEITMATIVIGAQWGDEVCTTFLVSFERITFFSLVSGFGDSEDIYLDFFLENGLC